MSTRRDERNKGISIQASSGSAALMIGPGIQAASVAIGYPGISIGHLRINMYTAPAMISVLLIVILGILVILVFKEYNMDILDKKHVKDEAGVMESAKYTVTSEEAMPPYDKMAAFSCAFTRFCILFCVTYDGTIGSPLTMTMFNWTSEQAVLYNGLLISSAGVVDLCATLIVGNIVLKYINERILMIMGLCMFLMFYMISFAYPNILPLLVDPAVLAINSTGLNVSSSCNFIWCSYTTRIEIGQWIAAYFFVPLSMSLAFTPSRILLSKVVGPRHQGFIQGINITVGCLALIMSPIIVSVVFESYGPRVAWSIAATVLIIGIATNSLTYKKLLPYDRSRITVQSNTILEVKT